MKQCIVVSLVLIAATTVNNTVIQGDILIGGLFVADAEKESSCDSISSQLQIPEAVRWTIDYINQKNYIPGIKIGLKTFTSNGHPSQTMEQTLRMLDNSTGRVFGLLGPETSAEMQPVSRFLSSLPLEKQIPQISFSATAATLNNRIVYRNIFRVIESDDVQVEVIFQLLLKLGWNYVAISYQDDTYGTDGATALKQKAEAREICVPVFQMVTDIKSIASLREMLDFKAGAPVGGMVYFGGGSLLRRILEYLNEHLQNVHNMQLVVSEALALNSANLKDGKGDVIDSSKGILSVTPKYDPVRDFTAYWNGLFNGSTLQTNDSSVMSVFSKCVAECEIQPGTDPSSCQPRLAHMFRISQQPLFVSYAVLGTLVLTEALKDVHSDVCNGQTGLCPQFESLSQEVFRCALEKLNFRPCELMPNVFSDCDRMYFKDGRLRRQTGGYSYEIFNFQRHNQTSDFHFTQVGLYDGKLALKTDRIHSYDKKGKENDVIGGNCPVGFSCQMCQYDPRKQIVHIRGDYYVIALVPIHNKASGDPFQYGKFRDSISVSIAEAITHAVDVINNRTGPFGSLLGSKSLGLIIMDTSNNPLIVRDLVIRLHKGELDVGDGVLSSAFLDRIIGYIGPVASSVSIPLSFTMKSLNQVFIAYASTSEELSDRREHPTFMRTAAPLHYQINPMMRVAKAVGATCIQIIYTEESYGQSGKNETLKGASKANICVAQVIGIEETTEETDFQWVHNRLKRFLDAKLVVVFVRSHTTVPLLQALNSDMEEGEFYFFGSGEGWAKRDAILEGNYKLRGSFSMAQDIPIDPNFETYFRAKMNGSVLSPWLLEFIEKTAKCYFPNSFVKTSSSGPLKPCTAELVLSHLDIDTWAPFAANALYALVMGFDLTLKAVCGGGSNICDGYTTEKLIKYTKTVKLDVYRDGLLRPVFDDGGNGASGFKITHIVRDPGSKGLVYRDIGMAVNDEFKFNKSQVDSAVKFKACPREYECPSTATLQIVDCNPDFRTPFIIAAAGGVGVILLLVVALVCVAVKYRRVTDHYDEINKNNMTYITPTSGDSNYLAVSGL